MSAPSLTRAQTQANLWFANEMRPKSLDELVGRLDSDADGIREKFAHEKIFRTNGVLDTTLPKTRSVGFLNKEGVDRLKSLSHDDLATELGCHSPDDLKNVLGSFNEALPVVVKKGTYVFRVQNDPQAKGRYFTVDSKPIDGMLRERNAIVQNWNQCLTGQLFFLSQDVKGLLGSASPQVQLDSKHRDVPIHLSGGDLQLFIPHSSLQAVKSAEFKAVADYKRHEKKPPVLDRLVEDTVSSHSATIFSREPGEDDLEGAEWKNPSRNRTEEASFNPLKGTLRSGSPVKQMMQSSEPPQYLSPPRVRPVAYGPTPSTPKHNGTEEIAKEQGNTSGEKRPRGEVDEDSVPDTNKIDESPSQARRVADAMEVHRAPEFSSPVNSPARPVGAGFSPYTPNTRAALKGLGNMGLISPGGLPLPSLQDHPSQPFEFTAGAAATQSTAASPSRRRPGAKSSLGGRFSSLPASTKLSPLRGKGVGKAGKSPKASPKSNRKGKHKALPKARAATSLGFNENGGNFVSPPKGAGAKLKSPIFNKHKQALGALPQSHNPFDTFGSPPNVGASPFNGLHVLGSPILSPDTEVRQDPSPALKHDTPSGRSSVLDPVPMRSLDDLPDTPRLGPSVLPGIPADDAMQVDD